MPTPDMTKSGRLIPSNFTPGVTAGMANARQQFAGLRIRFKHLDAPTQTLWWQAARVLNLQQGRDGKKKLTAATAYVMLNSGRLAIGLDIADTPGNDLNPPVPYPTVQVVATNINGVFNVRLVSQAFPVGCVLLLAKPQPLGKNYWADGSFKTAGTLDGLLSGSTSITSEVIDAVGVQGIGMEIPVRLLAVTDAGVKRGSLTAFGIVGGTAASDSGDDDGADTELNAA